MKQRSRNSAALVLFGTAGFLVMVGAVVFSLVELKYLAANESPKIVPVARELPAAADPFQPQPLDPVPELQPLPGAKLVAVPRPGIQPGSFRRVPEFTEMEAKAEAALNAPITVSFKDTDLKSALEKLSELTGVPIRTAAQSGLDEALGYDNARQLTLDFKNQPLRSVLATVYKTAFELTPESLGPGIRVTAAPTENGIEVGAAGYGIADERETRIYLVGHLLSDPEDTQQILNLLYDKTGGYWTVSAEGNFRGVRGGGMTMTVADDDDVLFMAQFAGSIVHLKSLGALVVNSNPQAHFEIVRTLRLLDEVSQVAAQQN